MSDGVDPRDGRIAGGTERAAIAGCNLVLTRLAQAVREENDHLSGRQSGDHRQFTERKTQLLRELMLAQRSCRGSLAAQVLKEPLQQIKQLLDRNQKLLSVHIKAVKDVSSIIVDALRRAESDGTYTRSGRA